MSRLSCDRLSVRGHHQNVHDGDHHYDYDYNHNLFVILSFAQNIAANFIVVNCKIEHNLRIFVV